MHCRTKFIYMTKRMLLCCISFFFQLRFWLLSLGHSLGFGSVIAKLLRIYYIFKYEKRSKQIVTSSMVYVYGFLSFCRYQTPGGSTKKVIHDRHLMAFVIGLAMIDVIILTTYTILEGVLYDFTPGIEHNKETSVAFEGVSGKNCCDINVIWLSLRNIILDCINYSICSSL